MGITHAENIFLSILSLNGEGVIVRSAYTTYIHGYSHAIYKYKVYFFGRFFGRFVCFWPFSVWSVLGFE